MTHPQLRQLAAQWRANRRLRYGALAILLILGTQLALSLMDRRTATETQYARDDALFARLQEASTESAWPRRAAAAEKALADMRHSIPPARSDGLAQAEMQAWLTDLAAHAGLASPTVRVESSLAVPGQPDVWQVLARLDADASPASLPVLVRTLSMARPWVATERLAVQSGSSMRVSLVVRGYFRPGDALDATEPPPRPGGVPAAAAAAPAPAGPPISPLATGGAG